MGDLWRRCRPSSLRGQLAGSFALLGTLLAVALSATLGLQQAAQAQRERSAELRAMADIGARRLAEGLALRAREVDILAASPTLWVDGLGAERVRQVFYRSQALNVHSAWIGVADADGRVVAATGRLLEGASVGERPWFVAGREGLHVGDVHPAKLLAKHLPPGSDGGLQRFVDFAAPIVRDGRLVGVIGIHGSWDWTHDTLTSLLPASAAARGIQLMVFDRQGRLIYAPGATLGALTAQGQTLPAPRAADGAVRWADGRDHLTAAARMAMPDARSDLGWTVVAREPVESAFAAARSAALSALALGLVGACLFAAAGAAVARSLTAPLKRLGDYAQRLQAHPGAETSPPVADGGGSVEVERLTGALVGAASRLQQANADLERRVQLRTEALARANAALAQLADHDALTGLLNRRGLDARAEQALATARRSGAPVSLLVVDADHFKRVNDQFGHDAGDDVLRLLATTLRHRLREVDIVARLGGEEFVAVLPATGVQGAAQVARALVERVAALDVPAVGGITVSVGVASWRHGEPTLRDTIARADAALYEAKRNGRNRVHVAPPSCDGGDGARHSGAGGEPAAARSLLRLPTTPLPDEARETGRVAAA